MPEAHNVLGNWGFCLNTDQDYSYFSRVTGLGVSLEAVEYREGGDPSKVIKLPGRPTFDDIELSYGVTQSNRMWKWLQDAVEGRIRREPAASIIVLGPDQQEVMRWNLSNCWLRACKLGPLDALGNEILIERITLVTETLERAGGE
jgi:phage tail-like protein